MASYFRWRLCHGQVALARLADGDDESDDEERP